MNMLKTIIAAALALSAVAAHADGVDLTQADCAQAKNGLVEYNQKLTKNHEYRRTVADKANYAYALACQAAGLIDIPMYLTQAPEASKEVRAFCQEHAKSRGETERCLVTGELDSEDE